MTKEVRKKKVTTSIQSNKDSEKNICQKDSMEFDTFVHIAPKKEYSIRIKINKIEKAKPLIKISNFDFLLEMDDDRK